jgi:2'-hydroxyisoflavone reductase
MMMSITRRKFVKNSLITGAALGLAGSDLGSQALAAFTRLRAERRLKILILGGTAFLGPAIVQHALARGHEVTLFNRGKTNAHLFPDLEKIQGDRKVSHDALKDRKWDVVIDTSGYYPRVVRDAAAALKGNIGQYMFISSISVYADFSKPGLNEQSPVGTIPDETVEEITGETYGPLKALCEQAAEAAFPGRTCNIRPGLIVGPMDRSDRFTYWPVRIARGGEVLVPDKPEIVTQVIDVRDLAEYIVGCAEKDVNGVFNATSPAEELTMGEIFEACKSVSGSDATFTWADGDWLEEQEIYAWSDMPVWVPLKGAEAGHPFIDVSRALSTGLLFRPITETVRDTLDWWANEPQERKDKPMRSGLTVEREAEILAKWHAREG